MNRNDVASKPSKLLKEDGATAECLKNLHRKYKLKFGIAFDAAGKQRRGKGWLTDYVVIDLTAALASKKSEIPDDLYQDALEIFRRAQKILQRSRAFFMLRLVPDLKKQKWSLALLLTNRDLAGTHGMIRNTAADLLPIMTGNKEFKAQYADTMEALCLYSHRDKAVYAFPSQGAITFEDHYQDCDEVEQSVLSDKCGEDIIRWSGVYLGNVNCFLERHREAIPHWQQAADRGEPYALMSIASAHVTLGNMQKAFQFSKKALENGVPRKLLDDPAFAEFRRHPLFAKLKGIRKKPPARLAKALSPKWSMPENLKELVEQNDGMWADERWKPIRLTVMSDDSSGGRKGSLTWQVEFDPYHRRFKAAAKPIKARGVEPAGDAWANFIIWEFGKRHPELAGELDSDSEMSTCVLYVKSESTCKLLLELIWSLI